MATSFNIRVMRNNSPLDLTKQQDGAVVTNYLSATQFLQAVKQHVELENEQFFYGLIVYGNAYVNRFASYNMRIKPIIWVVFNFDGNGFRPIQLEIIGDVRIQLNKNFLQGSVKNNAAVELQIYNEEQEYSPEVRFNKYCWSDNITGFVRDFYANYKTVGQFTFEPATKIITDDNIHFE